MFQRLEKYVRIIILVKNIYTRNNSIDTNKPDIDISNINQKICEFCEKIIDTPYKHDRNSKGGGLLLYI